MNHKRAIIVGATSGIGKEVARQLVAEGWYIGIAGRREALLKELQAEAPSQISIQCIDVQEDEAEARLYQLIEQVGGMDLFLQSSGIGRQNRDLSADIEIRTLETNGTGFVRMVGAAFRYFRKQGYGHIAVISSIAGTKGLGSAPAYSASKRFQNIYIDALEQLAYMQKIPVCFTDIRPGFVKTDILNDNKHYPMLMDAQTTARHIVCALKRKKRVAIIDWRYRLLVWGWRLIPRWIWKRLPVKN